MSYYEQVIWQNAVLGRGEERRQFVHVHNASMGLLLSLETCQRYLKNLKTSSWKIKLINSGRTGANW